MTYQRFGDLPDDIRDYIRKLGQADAEEWALTVIPALGNRSVFEIMNEPGGEEVVRDFVLRAVGKFT